MNNKIMLAGMMAMAQSASLGNMLPDINSKGFINDKNVINKNKMNIKKKNKLKQQKKSRRLNRK